MKKTTSMQANETVYKILLYMGKNKICYNCFGRNLHCLLSVEIEKTRIEFEINIENIKSTETEVRKSKLILGNNK